MAAFLCTLALGAAAAPLTEAEKALLRSGISEDAAFEMGKKADAAGLVRIIATGDPVLVGKFDYGMATARIEVLPPEVEALIVKHFDDPKLGKWLRQYRGRYTTRALFDKHYARLKEGYRSDDPSFEQILRTDLAGIEEELLQLEAKWPRQPAYPSGAVSFAGRRKHPAAVAPLIASLEASYRDDSRSLAWRPILACCSTIRPSTCGAGPCGDRAAARRGPHRQRTVQGGARAARSADEGCRRDSRPHESARRVRRLRRKRDAIRPGLGEIGPLKDSSPKAYVDAVLDYIRRIEALAAEARDEGVDREVANQYGQLGVYVRFRMGDPAQAVPWLEKASLGLDLVDRSSSPTRTSSRCATTRERSPPTSARSRPRRARPAGPYRTRRPKPR
jgi:hypothetical protein